MVFTSDGGPHERLSFGYKHCCIIIIISSISSVWFVSASIRHPHQSHCASKLNCQMIEKRSRAHAIPKHTIENSVFNLNGNILNGPTRSTLAMAFDEDRWIGEEVLLNLFIVMTQCY